jgi:hypothetical protein
MFLMHHITLFDSIFVNKMVAFKNYYESLFRTRTYHGYILLLCAFVFVMIKCALLFAVVSSYSLHKNRPYCSSTMPKMLNK